MRCEEVREKIVFFEELSEREILELLGHLAECPSCREFWEEEKKFRQEIEKAQVLVNRMIHFSYVFIASLIFILFSNILSLFSTSPAKTGEEKKFLMVKGNPEAEYILDGIEAFSLEFEGESYRVIEIIEEPCILENLECKKEV